VRLFAKGDRVAQPQYGSGTVTDANDRHIVIDFDEHGVRRFATSMVKLEPSSQPAPPPRSAARRTRKAATPKAATPKTATPKAAAAKAAVAKE
jgi:hypothetical protein